MSSEHLSCCAQSLSGSGTHQSISDSATVARAVSDTDNSDARRAASPSPTISISESEDKPLTEPQGSSLLRTSCSLDYDDTELDCNSSELSTVIRDSSATELSTANNTYTLHATTTNTSCQTTDYNQQSFQDLYLAPGASFPLLSSYASHQPSALRQAQALSQPPPYPYRIAVIPQVPAQFPPAPSVIPQPLPCAAGMRRAMAWSNSCLHAAFLFFFIIFLIVGIAMTCLGFLDYGESGPGTNKAFRILGVVALILCIGFLIAACVIISDCMTSSLKYGGENYSYHQLQQPGYSESFHNFPDAPMSSSQSGHFWGQAAVNVDPRNQMASFYSIPPNPQQPPGIAAQSAVCPTCSFHPGTHNGPTTQETTSTINGLKTMNTTADTNWNR